MPFLLVALFILVPIAELAIIIQVGQAIGVWWTIALLIADSILGSLLMRSQGRIAWRRFTEAVGTARVPAREVADGVLVIFGGALLLTPGFISDILGILLLLPPTRALARALVARRILPRLVVSRFGAPAASAMGGGPGAGARRSRPGRGRSADGDVEGTATEVDPPRLP